MAYFAFVTKIQDVHKDENSDRLYLGKCFGEGVIVGPDLKSGDLVLYFPTDGKILRNFGDKFSLFRKNLDGTAQGGYLEDNGHIRCIKLRGNQSSGIVISMARINEIYGKTFGLTDGDKIDCLDGERICEKYIPRTNTKSNPSSKKSYKGKKSAGIIYPEFATHTDTEQLAYNLHQFQPGDQINLTLKMHGTSQRSMMTYAELPRGFFRRLFHMKAKTKPAYVLGTRRCVVSKNSEGYYGNDDFRRPHHERIRQFVKPGMEIFYEVVGYYGEDESNTIMPIVDTKKINDKAFIDKYGTQMAFTYDCKPGESEMYVYRITDNNGEKEFTPEEITQWCEMAGVHRVPIIDNFTFTTQEDLLDRINKYFEDLTDPIGKTHIKEGVVVRIVNRLGFKAYKSKTWEFKVLEGIVKDSATAPDMEEAQEVQNDTI